MGRTSNLIRLIGLPLYGLDTIIVVQHAEFGFMRFISAGDSIRTSLNSCVTHRKRILGIFKTGLGCIFLGFLIIGLTFYLVGEGGEKEKIIIAVVGSVGGAATNFIGAIYIKVYAESMAALTGFHNRLVGTHHLHFANFLGAKIKDEKLREKTLAELSITLSVPSNNIKVNKLI